MAPLAPLFILKAQATRLARAERLPRHVALDRIAALHGFPRWSLLAERAREARPVSQVLADTEPGRLVLIAGRPQQGKTMLGMRLAFEAARRVGRSAVFSLDAPAEELRTCYTRAGGSAEVWERQLHLDTADDTTAARIAERAEGVGRGGVVLVDYLQLLDQRRTAPEVEDQVRDLRSFARARGAIVAVLSQIDRRFLATGRELPGLDDVRLPNPLDLGLFDRAVFLHGGRLAVKG